MSDEHWMVPFKQRIEQRHIRLDEILRVKEQELAEILKGNAQMREELAELRSPKGEPHE